MRKISLCFAILFSVLASPVRAFDVNDMHQDIFLKLSLKAMTALDANDKSMAYKTLIKLFGLRKNCHTKARSSIEYWFANQYRSVKHDKKNTAAYRRLLRSANYLADLDWEGAEKTLQQIPLEQLKNKSFQQLYVLLGAYFDYGRRYRAVIAMANSFLARGATMADFPPDFANRVAGAWFVVSDIKPFVAYLETNPSAAVHDWMVTSHMRLGNTARARELQALLNKRDPNNFTQLMSMNTAERERLCKRLIPLYNEGLSTDASEATSGGVTPNVWAFLLCGKFEDAVNAVKKEVWVGQLSSCQATADTHNLTDGYNGLVACVYWANKLRVTGRKNEAQGQLLACVENIKRTLFIDKSTAYSQAPVVLDDDLDLYMKNLFGWNTEVYVLRGMLMEALQRYQDAVLAYEVVLNDHEAIPESLRLRVAQWQQRVKRKLNAAQTTPDNSAN